MTRLRSEQGTSLIEVLIASAILITLMAGLMAMMGLSIRTTENQGHLAARTTEYAQDKMEQLLALSFTDGVSDTRTFPAASSGGSGLAIGGSADPDSPVDSYTDYLDESGNLVASVAGAAPSSWFYKRVWKIEYVSGSTTLKKITVATSTSRGFGGAMKPTAYLAVLKTSPF